MNDFILGMICGAIITTVFIVLGFWTGIRWSIRQDFHAKCRQWHNIEWHEQFKEDDNG